MDHSVIVGGGQAGHALASKLRSEGYAGRITLLCAEAVQPYQRPPLSKGYLLGSISRERLFFRPRRFYEENEITLRIGIAATALHPAGRTLLLSNGELVSYDKLALTLGGRPTRLGEEANGISRGVHTIRGLDDVDTLREAFGECRSVVVVGGGYVGLEAAAVSRKLGLQVTVVEAAERILKRVASAGIADRMRAIHRLNGVQIEEGIGVKRITGTRKASGVQLQDGREITADLVLVGIGMRPEVELAAQAGLTVDNGIATDETCRTSDASIWAAGDCASFPYRNGRLRLESVGNAVDMAECAAINMAGGQTRYLPTPWFWSDQYDAKLQIVGVPCPNDNVVARPGKNGGISFWHIHAGKLKAVEAVNDPVAYVVGKRILETSLSCDLARIDDPEFEIRTLLPT